MNICYGFKEKLFKGGGGGPIGLRNLTTYFQYLNRHSSSKENRSKIRDFIPAQEIIDGDEFLTFPRESKEEIIDLLNAAIYLHKVSYDRIINDVYLGRIKKAIEGLKDND